MRVGGFESFNASEFDPYHIMMAGMPYMVEQARAGANKHASSYRGFHVGAAAFAVKWSTSETAIFNGGNIKPTPDRPKICAEGVTVRQAEKYGFEEILGIVVVATTDIVKIEEVTGARTPTLHPCSECQDPAGKVAGNALMRPGTLVVTAGIDHDIYQVHTLQELQDAYGDSRGDSLLEARPGFAWELATATYDFLSSQNDLQGPSLRQPESALARKALLTQIVR